MKQFNKKAHYGIKTSARKLALMLAFAGFATAASAQSPTYTISGTVYDDGDGYTNFDINGTPTSVSNAASGNRQLYAYLINTDFQIEKISQVIGGTYSFTDTADSYTVALSVTNPVNAPIGSSQGSLDFLSSIYYAPTAEGTPPSTYDNGLSADYLFSISPTSNTVVNFGIDQRPVGTNFTVSAAYAGTPANRDATGLIIPNAAFHATDGEDGTYVDGFFGRTVVLSGVVGGTLYYNGTAISAGSFPFVIQNFDNSLLRFRYFNFPAGVSGRRQFTFNVYDNAGVNQATSNLITIGNPLPVNLTGFTGRMENNNAQIQWTTSKEYNSSYFDLERSVDGRTFTAIKTISSKATDGSSNWDLTYNYNDGEIANLAATTVYYRLKQVDLDGHFVYSNSIKLNKQNTLAANDINTYPNPAISILNVDVPLTEAQNVIVSVMDMGGKTVSQQAYTSEAGNLHITMDLTTLPRGSYFLKVKGDAGLDITKKLALVKG